LGWQTRKKGKENRRNLLALQIVDARPDGFELRARIDQGGHRSAVRALALASDDSSLLSASAEGAKLWSPGSGACVGTLEGGYGLCAVFAPGNRHAVVGTKVGGGWGG
jgi:U3 small nucleolar RNA-associated protein 12